MDANALSIHNSCLNEVDRRLHIALMAKLSPCTENLSNLIIMFSQTASSLRKAWDEIQESMFFLKIQTRNILYIVNFNFGMQLSLHSFSYVLTYCTIFYSFYNYIII